LLCGAVVAGLWLFVGAGVEAFSGVAALFGGTVAVIVTVAVEELLIVPVAAFAAVAFPDAGSTGFLGVQLV
jgi:hypothetical protein